MGIQSIIEYIYIKHSNKCQPNLNKINSCSKEFYYSKLITFLELLRFHSSTKFRLDARKIYSEFINAYEEIICNIDLFQDAFDINAIVRKAVSVEVSDCLILELTPEDALRCVIRDMNAMDIDICTDIEQIKQKSPHNFVEAEIFILFDLPLFANAMSVFFNPLILNNPLEKKKYEGSSFQIGDCYFYFSSVCSGANYVEIFKAKLWQYLHNTYIDAFDSFKIICWLRTTYLNNFNFNLYKFWFEEFKDIKYYKLSVVFECLTNMIEYGKFENWELLDKVVDDLKMTILDSDMLGKEYKSHTLQSTYESLLQAKDGFKPKKHKKIVHKIMLDNLYLYGIIDFSEYSKQLEKIKQKMLIDAKRNAKKAAIKYYCHYNDLIISHLTPDEYKFCLGELDYSDSLKYFVTSGSFHFYFPVGKISLLYLDSIIEQCYLLVHKTKKSMSQYLTDIIFSFPDVFDLGSNVDVVTNKILEFSEGVFGAIKFAVIDELIRFLDSDDLSRYTHYREISDGIISYKKKTSTIPRVLIEKSNYSHEKFFNSGRKFIPEFIKKELNRIESKISEEYNSELDAYINLQKPCSNKFMPIIMKYYMMTLVKELFDEAERIVFEKEGVKKYKWASELALYHMVRDKFKAQNINVYHQGSPHWIKPQRLDIWIPQKNLAIEYQGEQHFMPVDFFGGEYAFEKNKARDKRKLDVCIKNGIELKFADKNTDFKSFVDSL